MSKRQYMCYWGSDFAEPGILRLHSVSFFSEKYGYSDEDIEGIVALDIGETWTSDGYSTHVVTRVEDINFEIYTELQPRPPGAKIYWQMELVTVKP